MEGRLRRPLLILIPVLASLIWSSFPALQAVAAAGILDFRKEAVLGDGNSPLEHKRRLQKHFLNHGVYIPLSDITLANGENSIDQQRLFSMRKICGQGKIFVWIPLKFRFPILGEKVVEWCLNI